MERNKLVRDKSLDDEIIKENEGLYCFEIEARTDQV